VFIAGIPSAIWGTNCWVVASGDGEHCLIVDPGADVGSRLEDILTEHRLHPVAVMLTITVVPSRRVPSSATKSLKS